MNSSSDEIAFATPGYEGKVAITARDITANLPFVPGAHLVFDHHESETVSNAGRRDINHIIDASAPSAARVIFNHYGGKAAFPRVSDDMMAAVDQADSAQYTREDILSPQGWVLLSYLMDSRTGLGRFKEFRISNYALMMDLIQYCRDHTIDEILALPDVQERVALYKEHATKAREQILHCGIHRQRWRWTCAGRNHRDQPLHGVCAVPAGHRVRAGGVGLKSRTPRWQPENPY